MHRGHYQLSKCKANLQRLRFLMFSFSWFNCQFLIFLEISKRQLYNLFIRLNNYIIPKIITSMSKISQHEKKYDKAFKLLLIGNSGVGKSSILLQYSDKKFAHNYYNTIGVDYKIKYVPFQDKTIKLQIWDTAGQDRFKTITSSYYRGADGIIVVYDMTDKTSFDNVKMWLEEIQKYVSQKTLKYIIGNKNDLEQKRQVSLEQASEFTNKLGLPFRETSARLSTNIDSLFQQIIEKLLSSQLGQSKSKSSSKPPEQSPQTQKPPKNIKQLIEQKKSKQQTSCCNIY